MSLRARGRGARAVRGRPRGSTKKSTAWTYRVYSPEPEVYESLTRVRRAPPTITRSLADECPIADAQTRILVRRQTEDGLCRHYYRVEITYKTSPSRQNGTSSARSSVAADEGAEDAKVVEVDNSCILRYVSARELERFENAEFRAEAEAEAIAKQAARDELVRMRMEKNARAVSAAMGSSTLLSLGMGEDKVARRGRPPKRGWSRGRGGRGGFANLGERNGDVGAVEAEVEDDGNIQMDSQEDLERIIDDTEDEEDELAATQLQPNSPAMHRSSFVLGSALVDSSTLLTRKLPGLPEIDESSDEEDSSSSAAQQLMTERQLHKKPLARQDSGGDSDTRGRHPTKRRKTESASSSRLAPASRKPMPKTTLLPSKPLNHKTLPARPSAHHHTGPTSESDSDSASLVPEISESNPINSASANPPIATPDDDDDDDDNNEDEVAISAILAHSYDDGRKYYLVKWAGYADAEDWVVESDLAGAREMVEEYEGRRRRR